MKMKEIKERTMSKMSKHSDPNSIPIPNARVAIAGTSLTGVLVSINGWATRCKHDNPPCTVRDDSGNIHEVALYDLTWIRKPKKGRK